MNVYHPGNRQARPIPIGRRNPAPECGTIDEKVNGAWGPTVRVREFGK